MHPRLEIRSGCAGDYPDVLTPTVKAALEALAPLDTRRRALMAQRIERVDRHLRNQSQSLFRIL